MNSFTRIEIAQPQHMALSPRLPRSHSTSLPGGKHVTFGKQQREGNSRGLKVSLHSVPCYQATSVPRNAAGEGIGDRLTVAENRELGNFALSPNFNLCLTACKDNGKY